MRVCALELRGFRGIKSGELVFPKHSVLMGANNAGKSTVVEALSLLFARDRMTDPLSDWDFYGGRPDPTSRFYIIATVVDFPSNSIEASPDWFIGEGRARPSWWNDDKSTLHCDADPPPDTILATQIALAGRYDEETCAFEVMRYFYYGEGDPFTDSCAQVSQTLLKQVGFFLLASNREWDKLLSFNSSSLLKVLRENDAIPGPIVETLKQQLRTDVEKPEGAEPLKSIIDSATAELKAFSLINVDSRLAYRPTSLDSIAVLRSLTAHVMQSDGTLLPVAKHGAGLVALQAFLLLLSFAEKRKKAGRNFVLAAEEPELHLHPSLHQRLAHRIRGASTQSIVTTQSPHVAASYQPSEVVFVKNHGGHLSGQVVRTEPINAIARNTIRKLYREFRHSYYEALMGGLVLVPEGISDQEWLLLFQRVAQSSPDVSTTYEMVPITVVPTSDADVVATFAEIARFRDDAIPFLDGDGEGDIYERTLLVSVPKPKRILRLGAGAAIECLVAWILEPSIDTPGPALAAIGCNGWSVGDLQAALIARKGDRYLRESLAWEALDDQRCHQRACEFFHDVSAITVGRTPRNGAWTTAGDSSCRVHTATHIKKA